MCGIVIIIDTELEPSQGRRLCRAALRSIGHRGPDDAGIHCAPPAFLGHCRLGVIDPRGSRQPMADPSGRYVLAYNGTTYNFKELRSALKGRWRFVSRGDTEVVLAGLVLEGPDFLQRMTGMWAGALWDGKLKRLLLFRDRLGQKPLYYMERGRALAVASEIGALHGPASFSPDHDLDSTADFFRYGFCLPGKTFYRQIREVLPGHYARWQPSAPLVQEAYWTLPRRSKVNRPDETLAERFEQAVLDRLVSDVPVGVFLSGGVDSSLIASICCRNGRRLPGFTLGFEDPDFDERPFAGKVAQLYCGGYRQVIFPEPVGHEDIKAAMSNLGQPFGDPSLLALGRLAKSAAGQVKVALGGDGGDEIFGGYQRYRAQVIMRWYTRLPRRLRRTAEKLVRSFPEPVAHHSRSLLKMAHLFLNMLDDGAGKPYVAPRLFSDGQLERLLPDLHQRGHEPPSLPETCTGPDDLERMLAADMLVYLPQDICCKSDRATMAHGLELRAPFLDHRLVELAFGIGAGEHVGFTGGKRQLRRVFENYLPAFVWRRRKQGFCLPLHRWFSGGELGQALRGRLSANCGPLSREYVLNLLAEHESGSRDRSLQLWALWSYLAWL